MNWENVKKQTVIILLNQHNSFLLYDDILSNKKKVSFWTSYTNIIIFIRNFFEILLSLEKLNLFKIRID